MTGREQQTKKSRRKNKTTEFPLVYGRQSELSGSEKQPARQEPRDVVEELIHSAEANAGAGGVEGGSIVI